MANLSNIVNITAKVPVDSISLLSTGTVSSTSIKDAIEEISTDKQESLVDGINIKTINGQSLLGSGNITTAESTAGVDVKPGTIIRSSKGIPSGYLPCNGALLDQTSYSDLYNAVGNNFSYYANRYINGQPWRQQYKTNMGDGVIGAWTIGTDLPGVLHVPQAIITNSRVYLLGGYVTGSVSTVYTAPINSDGTLGTWTTGTSLPGALYASQAIVTNSRVYLLGGISNSNYVSTVYTAPINSDGTLGTWTTGTSLPGVLAYSQAIVTNSRVYLLGGNNGSASVSTVYTAPINSDGTLGTWTTGTSLPGVLAYSQAIVTNSRVYLLGGWTTAEVSTVYTAPINSDGTLGTWTTGTSLPGALSYSQAIVTNSRVYLLGGYTTAAVATVYTAPINSDGTLGTWTTGTSLPGALSYSQAIVTNSRVYLLGGYTTAAVATVYTAPINSDGTLGTWTTGTSLPANLAWSQAIVTNSRVYLLGGNNGSINVPTVYTAPLSGGKNNYLDDTFYQTTPTSGKFYIPDLIYEEAPINNTTVRSYIKY